MTSLTGLRRLALRLLTEQRPFEEILSGVCAEARVQAMILDKDARLLANSDTVYHENEIWAQILEEKGIPYHYFLEQTQLLEDLWRMTKTRGPIRQGGAGGAPWLVFAPVLADRALAGYVAVCADGADDVAALEELALLLGRLYTHKKGRAHAPAGQPDSFFVSAITWELLASDAETVSELVLRGPERMGMILDGVRLPVLRPAFLTAAISAAGEPGQGELTRLGERLRDPGQDLYYLVEDRLLLVLFVNIRDGQLPALYDRVGAFAADHGLRCGLSLPFERLEQRRYHKAQALSALRLGGRLEPKARVFAAGALYPELMFQAAADRLGAQVLWRTDLQELVAHDQNHGTAYLETLTQFLSSGCNATTAANRLFIDRSTLNYRLAKIRTMVRCDLGDPDEALRLWIALRIRSMAW